MNTTCTSRYGQSFFCKLIGAICVIPLVILQRIHANVASSALRLAEKMSDLGAMNQTVWHQCHTLEWIIHQKQKQKKLVNIDYFWPNWDEVSKIKII